MIFLKKRGKFSSSMDMSYMIDCDEGTFEQEQENQANFRSGFPAGFKRARKEAGLTQEQFSEVFGFSLTSIRSWEQGRHIPEIDTIEKICNFFHCSVDYLLNRTDHRDPDEQLICEATGLDVDALASLRSFKSDTQAMAVINHLLSYRPQLERLVLLFASEYWKQGCIGSHAEGRIISGYMRHNDEKVCLINVVEELTKEIEDFYRENKDDQIFSKQMAFRLLQETAKEYGIDLSSYVYRKLQENGVGKHYYTDEQIKIAVEFLKFCGYREDNIPCCNAHRTDTDETKDLPF